jgi:hypothetical protein
MPQLTQIILQAASSASSSQTNSLVILGYAPIIILLALGVIGVLLLVSKKKINEAFGLLNTILLIVAIVLILIH